MLPLLLALLGCSDVKTDDTAGVADTAPSGPGTLSLTFGMDTDYISNMSEPPSGSFLGSVYAEADASSIGPVDGAVPLFDLQVDGLDLSSGGPTAVVYTSDPLDAQIVWILGCLDSDGNDCDYGDPITVPNTNKVQVAAGVDTTFNVYFGMLNPQK